MKMNKHIWEGWTAQDFVDELAPTIKMIMKKFVYYFEPNGTNFYLKAHTLKEAKTKLKKSLGGVPYYVGETEFRTARQPKSQMQFEHKNA